MRICLKRFEHGRQKAVDGLGIDNAKCQLSRLGGDQPSPDGVSLRPDVFSFVIEAAGQLIYDDAKRNRVEPRNNTPVKFRRASIHPNSVKSLRVTKSIWSFFPTVAKHQ